MSGRASRWRSGGVSIEVVGLGDGDEGAVEGRRKRSLMTACVLGKSSLEVRGR